MHRRSSKAKTFFLLSHVSVSLQVDFYNQLGSYYYKAWLLLSASLQVDFYNQLGSYYKVSLLFQEGPRISNYFLLPSFSNDPRIAHTEDLVMGSKRKRATSLPCTHTSSLSFLFLFFLMSLSFLKTIFVANPLSCVSPC